MIDDKIARIKTLKSIYYAKSGHPGGSLSTIDILIELVNSGDILKANSKNKFILSKGHACPALYAVASELGLISDNDLYQLRKLGSLTQGHPHSKLLPWLETSTGSLGQGFSVAIGMCLGYKHLSTYERVYVLVGDGELQEGEIWEGAMCAAHYKLDNLCLIIDYNKLQSDNLNSNIMQLEPLKQKWESFGWDVIEIDGHSITEINNAIKIANNIINKPCAIIANTIKGKGVTYMESSPLWHGSVMLTKEDMYKALIDLHANEKDLFEFKP
jgi:transketolase